MSNNRLRRHSSVSQLFYNNNPLTNDGKMTVRSKRQNNSKDCPFEFIYMKPQNDEVMVFNEPNFDQTEATYPSEINSPKNASCNSSPQNNASPQSNPNPNYPNSIQQSPSYAQSSQQAPARQSCGANPPNVTPSPMVTTTTTPLNAPSNSYQCSAKTIPSSSSQPNVNPAVQQPPTNVVFQPVPIKPSCNLNPINATPPPNFLPTAAPVKAIPSSSSQPNVSPPAPVQQTNTQPQVFKPVPIVPSCKANPTNLTPQPISAAPINAPQRNCQCPLKTLPPIQPVNSPSTAVQQSPSNIQNTPPQYVQISQQAPGRPSSGLNPINVSPSQIVTTPRRICNCPAKPSPPSQLNANPSTSAQQTPSNVQNPPPQYVQSSQQAPGRPSCNSNPANGTPLLPAPVNTASGQYQCAAKAPPVNQPNANPSPSNQQPPTNVVFQPVPLKPICNSASPPSEAPIRQYLPAPVSPAGQTTSSPLPLDNNPNRRCGFCIKNAFIFMGFQPKDVEVIKKALTNFDEGDDDVAEPNENTDCMQNVVRISRKDGDGNDGTEQKMEKYRDVEEKEEEEGDCVEDPDSPTTECQTKEDLVKACHDLSQTISRYRKSTK
ncbi:vegetative cell wall protein gp1-like [Contarinia nasturtii]|uniref:vegetative cell wall protein gp1-like n=1 Tax=Contarinia nasturtii TaxID=265458 RepID=UPI0012D46D6E|nr:vegetative cell wall protein gp1-like [Contarinia nasturtii]